MDFRRRPKTPLTISITPMIDIVFLLLIFFMVTTSFNRESELKINLPEAKANEVSTEKGITLTISAEGNYFINKKKVVNQNLETLNRALRQAAGNDRNQDFVIHADAKTPHQAVISALDVAGQLGFKKITFAALQPAQK